MPLAIVLLALLGGVAGHAVVFDRIFALSWIDGIAIGIALAGLITAVRHRRFRFDLAAFGYLGVLAVAAVQVIVLPGTWDLVGGATRFAVPLLCVLGASQLLGERDGPAWRWPLVLGGFGAVLGTWTMILAAGALADPERTRFYDVKNAVVMPLGASNYVAAFLLVAAVVAGTYAVRERGAHIPLAILSTLGLIATMSRAALLAGLVVLLVAGLVLRSKALVAAVTGTVLVGLLALVIAAGGVATLLGEPVDPGPDGEVSAFESTLRGALIGETAGRRQLFSSAWSAFSDSPVIGVGFNRVAQATSGSPDGHPNVHNLGLHSLVSTGVLGTIAYLGLWVLLVWRIARMPRGTERTALALGVGALVLHAQVEALAYTRAVEVLVACLLVVAGSASPVGIRRWGSGFRPAPVPPVGRTVPATAAGTPSPGSPNGRAGSEPRTGTATGSRA